MKLYYGGEAASNLLDTESITVSWEKLSVASIDARLTKLVALTEFTTCYLKDDDDNLLEQGVLISPAKELNRSGAFSPVVVKGWDWNLKRFLSPVESLTSKTITQIMTSILELSPYTVGTVGTFYLSQDPFHYDDALELASGTFVDTALSFNNVEEYDTEVVNGATVYAQPCGRYRSTFWDGARKFVFFADGGTLKYRSCGKDHSYGSIKSTALSITGTDFDVHLRDDKVYLFLNDGVNTDCYRGTIATDTITFVAQAADIFAGWMECAASFTAPNGYIMIASGRNLWVSEDDGVTFSNDWTTDAAGDRIAWIFMVGTADDMTFIIDDNPNSDLESWDYDYSATDAIYAQRLNRIDEVITLICGDQNDDFNCTLIWGDNSFLGGYGNCVMTYKIGAADWATWWVPITGVNIHDLTVCCDHDEGAYLAISQSTWIRIGSRQNNNQPSMVTYVYSTPDGAGNWVQSPQNSNGQEQQAVYFCVVDVSDDIHDYQLTPNHINTSAGSSSGSYTTYAYAPAGLEKWGILYADLVDKTDLLSWQILKTSDDSVLLNIAHLGVDLDEQGLSASETSIKIKTIWTNDSGRVAELVSIYVGTQTTTTTDWELYGKTCLEELRRLGNLVGGYPRLNTDNTVDLVASLGTDKSATIKLINDEDGNCILFNREVDFSGYANGLSVFGGSDGSGGNYRVDVMNSSEVTRIAAITGDIGHIWETLDNKDLSTLSLANTEGITVLSGLSAPKYRTSGSLIDTDLYDFKEFNLGSTIAVQIEYPVNDSEEETQASYSANLEIVKAVRISRIGSADVMSLELSANALGQAYLRRINEISTVKRWSNR